jgi:hypothetical protein
MNVSQIPKWKNMYPTCDTASDIQNTIYLKIVQNMIVDGEDDTYQRIITNISNKIVIDKCIPKNMMIMNYELSPESEL